MKIITYRISIKALHSRRYPFAYNNIHDLRNIKYRVLTLLNKL